MRDSTVSRPLSPVQQLAQEIEKSAGTLDEYSEPPLRPFPTGKLPRIMRDMVRETSKASLTPECLAAINVIGAVSASIGAGYLINSGGDRTTSANLFILGIAQSGTGKGQAFSRIFKPFRDAEQQHNDRWRNHGHPKAESEINLIDEQIKEVKKEVKKQESQAEFNLLRDKLTKLQRRRDELSLELEKSPSFSVADVTREKLALSLSNQPGEALASLSPEARGVLSVLAGRYSSTGSSDEDIYLSSYSRESILIDRISRPATHLHNPTLSILWLIQPDAAARFGEKIEMVDSGLLPRFLLANTHAELEDEPEFPHKIDNSIADQWASLITGLLTNVRAKGDQPDHIPTARGVYNLMRDFTNQGRHQGRKNGDKADIAPFVARWGENCWRLVLVIHAGKYGPKAHRHPVSEETASSAIVIMQWFITEQITFLGEQRRLRRKTRMKKLAEILRDAGGDKTLRTLKKDNGFEPGEVKKIASQFSHCIRVEKIKTKGRPSEVAILQQNSNRQ
ncbi:DUF3987 domain-containing protein [Verrucomicrobiaceae bacterium N1E253]|uniref:DUF3987 domain-containing protein n=1 Tax=Oceaniferula marina TaxID=2748318 RepID=A0A851GNE6_9BACT|nr:DUF3987 domain-containing protein [Oceaniferula marina]NWK55654.1 DUF3987 domain-containing protein [Oceaniferula marina]